MTLKLGLSDDAAHKSTTFYSESKHYFHSHPISLLTAQKRLPCLPYRTHFFFIYIVLIVIVQKASQLKAPNTGHMRERATDFSILAGCLVSCGSFAVPRFPAARSPRLFPSLPQKGLYVCPQRVLNFAIFLSQGALCSPDKNVVRRVKACQYRRGI